MIAAFGLSAEKVRVATDAGWLLAFHSEDAGSFTIADKPLLEISRDDYYGDLRASLPGGLEGGVYTFLIEGLTDTDYGKISLAKNPLQVVRLYLYWRDMQENPLNALGSLVGLPDLAGSGKAKQHQKDLVAELRVVSVTRRAGTLKYETTITARERLYDLAATRRPCGAEIDAAQLESALNELMNRMGKLQPGIQFKFHGVRANKLKPPAPPADQKDNKRKLDTSLTCLDLLTQLAARIELESNLYGRGMLLIRNGFLHIGARPLPVDPAEKKPKELTLETGLLEVEALSPTPTDPNYDPCKNDYKPAPTRAQLKLTLKGRPDLKPGDLVKLDAPDQDVASTKGPLEGAFGTLGDIVKSFIPGEMAHPTILYVSSVEHQLSRTTGFLTTLTGVMVGQKESDLTDADRLWDAHTPGKTQKSREADKVVNANPETQVGKTIARAIHAVMEKISLSEVGEVREVFPADPHQTLTVWRGVKAQNSPNGTRTAAIERPSNSPAPTMPYATPFAWGSCGLILPRYPGMRVVVAHRNGLNHDPIDIGATWKSDAAPANGELGDWWLILPADSPAGSPLAETNTDEPPSYTGKVTHDLIQANGDRTIEVGSLTIRYFKDGLKNADQRPKAGVANSVTIEHANGKAKVVIDQDGNINIEGQGIRLKAEKDLTIEAKNVNVSCDSMDVS